MILIRFGLVVIFIILLLQNLYSTEPDPRPVYNYIYFIDENCNKTLGPYASARPFSEGLAAVQDEVTGKWGYINKFGEWVISPQYDFCGDFKEGLAAVATGFFGERWRTNFKVDLVIPEDFSKTKGRWGFIDKRGVMRVNDIYSNVLPFSEGIAAVELYIVPLNKFYWGYIDKQGHWIIEPQFTRASNYHQGIAIVSFDRETQYEKYLSIEYRNIDNSTDNRTKRYFYYIDRSGKLLFNSESTSKQLIFAKTNFCEGFALAKIYDFDKKTFNECIIDNYGKIQEKSLNNEGKYRSLSFCFPYVFDKNSKNSYIPSSFVIKDGIMLDSVHYNYLGIPFLKFYNMYESYYNPSSMYDNDYSAAFYEDKAPYSEIDSESRNRIGYMNTKGVVVIKPEYTGVYPFSEGKAFVVVSDNVLRLIDSKGEALHDFKEKVTPISGFQDGLALVCYWKY